MERTAVPALGRRSSVAGRRLPLARWLIRQRRAVWIRAAVLVALFTAALLWRAPDPASRLAPLIDRPLGFIEVIDGATLRVAPPQAQPVDVSLLGVQIDPGFAESTRAALRQLCQSAPLRASFDLDRPVDQLDRPTGYLYLADGRMLNEHLIEQGLARADAAVRHALADHFARLQARAASRRSGLWASPTPQASSPHDLHDGLQDPDPGPSLRADQ